MFEGLKASIAKEVERHRNRPFMEAAMAASALVAIADGVVSFSERNKVDQIIENLTQLRVFDVHEAIDVFNDYLDNIRESGQAGRAAALSAVEKVKDVPDASLVLLKVCVSISNADGEFSEAERRQVDEICARLGHTLEEVHG